MESEVKIRLSIPRKMYDQMKEHPEIDWNEAAIREISKRFASVGIIIGGKKRQNPESNHHKV